ncbi:MAG: n-acetylglutamate synthase [Balneolaceae bacterium]|nr:n-acetylglutamate synthase [Balneolaceae bacterium]
MNRINYHGRSFRSSSNSDTGEVSDETIFHYHQDGKVIWAEYSGGAIVRGSIIGKVNEDNNLDFVYQHINRRGELKTGKCHSTPRILDDGRIELQEKWTWTSGDCTSGTSTIEEIKNSRKL